MFYVKYIGHTKPQNFTQSKCFVFSDLWSCEVNVKVKQKACYRPRGFQQVEGPWLGGKVVNPTHRPSLPPGCTAGTNFYYTLSRPQGNIAAGRFMSIKNSNDAIGDRTRDLPVCSAHNLSIKYENNFKKLFYCRKNKLRSYESSACWRP